MVAAVTAWPSRFRMHGAEMAKFAVVTSKAATVQDALEPLGKLCCVAVAVQDARDCDDSCCRGDLEGRRRKIVSIFELESKTIATTPRLLGRNCSVVFQLIPCSKPIVCEIPHQEESSVNCFDEIIENPSGRKLHRLLLHKNL